MSRKRTVTGAVHVDVYAVVQRAVEEGALYGWRRAHKHMDNPDEDTATEAIAQAVMNELCEVLQFDFGDDDDTAI